MNVIVCVTLKRVKKTLTGIALSLACGVFLTFIVDYLAGIIFASGRPGTGLIWGAGSTVSHSTSEFDYVAHINNLGFRDHPFLLRKSATTKRIVVLGDSFTYGWGVSMGETWPKLVESRLNSTRNQVEVADLGSPGAGPYQYADLAERVIPLLRPDLVVVALVQADDLLQSTDPHSGPTTVRDELRHFFYRFYPNLIYLLDTKERLVVPKRQLTATWKKQVDNFLKTMSTEERQRFEGLSRPIRSSYLTGDLNPGLLYYAIRYPNFLLDYTVPLTPLASDLRRIRSAAGRSDAALLVLSVPYRAYASSQDMEATRNLGFHVRRDMVTTNEPDNLLRRACRQANVPFAEVTAQFRERATREELYFTLDGHLNPAGHSIYAELVTPIVTAAFR